MSAEYIAFLKDENYGPVGFEDLKEMWKAGDVMDETYVRLSDREEWSTWKIVRKSHEQDQAIDARNTTAFSERKSDSPPAQVRALNLPGVRDKLREMTGYPALRVCLIILLVISVIGLALSGWAMTDADYRTLGIAGAISCLGSIFSILILGVLLDIADALLAKLD
jgi:hypothetical protein